MNIFTPEALKRVDALGDRLEKSGLDPDKLFSKYISVRELAFCFIPDLIEDKEFFKIWLYELTTFLADIMVIDNAYAHNLYHCSITKLDDDLSEERKKILLENIDKYIKPRENKQNPDLNRFAAGCLTYKLSYENSHTSKDEARKLSEFLFNLSETEIRNCTKQFQDSYFRHTAQKSLSASSAKHAVDALLFLRIAEILDEKKESFGSLFKKYQERSDKRTSTTQKTYDGYQAFKNQVFETIKPLIDPTSKVINFRPKLSLLVKNYRHKQGQDFNERDLSQLHQLINLDLICPPFSNSL